MKLTRSDIPSLYRSALISAGGLALALLGFFSVKALFPEQDMSVFVVAFMTAFGAWFTNLIKKATENKE